MFEMTSPLLPRDLLRIVGAHLLPHTDTSLEIHLFETYRLLAKWGNGPTVCLAGLLHSVYGTEFYLHRCLGDTDRTWLANLVGEETENLVHLYSSLRLSDLFDGKASTSDGQCISSEVIRKLLEVHAANLMEQWPKLEHVMRMAIVRRDSSRWLEVKPLLSIAASRAIQARMLDRSTGE